jgi:tryptophan synthase alpha chain
VLEDYLRNKLQSQPLLVMMHLVAGYPSLEDNWRMLEAMRDAGVALVELQFPFSEPIADGPVFVRANQLALQQGMYGERYFNPVFRLGGQRFCDALEDAGGRGYIIADLPPELAVDLDVRAREAGLDPIHLMTPANSEARLREIAVNAAGFVYCVARKGVTGKQTALGQDVTDYLDRCRKATGLPIGLGFGIRTTEDLRQLKGHADIAIIGTACLEIWEREGEKAYRDYLHALQKAAGRN